MNPRNNFDEKGFALIIVWIAIGLTSLFAAGASYFVIPGIAEHGLDFFKPTEVREQQAEVEGLLQMVEDVLELEKNRLNIEFPENPNEPLSNPLDPNVPPTENREGSLQFVEPDESEFKEVTVPPATPEPPPIVTNKIICGGLTWQDTDLSCLEEAKTLDPGNYEYTRSSLCALIVPDFDALDVCYEGCTGNLLDSLKCENACRKVYIDDAYEARNQFCPLY